MSNSRTAWAPIATTMRTHWVQFSSSGDLNVPDSNDKRKLIDRLRIHIVVGGE